MLLRIMLSVFLSCLTFQLHASDNPMLRIVTNKGNIELELDRTRAPITVNNFLQYTKDGFYTDTIFHRVIKGFMIQGGGFTPDLEQKPTRAAIENEAFNGLGNQRGTIAMARTNMPHSATSQFFINTKNNDFLNYRGKSMRDWGYTVFGKVTSGMQVVDNIENSLTGPKGRFSQDVPLNNIVIQQVIILSE